MKSQLARFDELGSLRRAVARRALGSRYGRARELWHRLPHPLRARRRRRRRVVLDAYLAQAEPAVASGPFKGLRYTDEAIAHDPGLTPKLLGSYELELHDELESALAKEPIRVVNIGAADGYYAVGLALRAPGAEVIAYEADPAAAVLCVGLARANGVGARIDVRGSCTVQILADLDLDGALIVCDCEGCERELIDPEAVDGLAGATIIVEVHDFIAPGVGGLVASRLSPTHELAWIESTGRDPRSWPLASLERSDAELALDEDRPSSMRWLAAVPKPG